MEAVLRPSPLVVVVVAAAAARATGNSLAFLPLKQHKTTPRLSVKAVNKQTKPKI